MERRTRVLELSAFGMTDDEIAIEVGYANRSGVWKARQRALAHHQAEAAENYRTLEVAVRARGPPLAGTANGSRMRWCGSSWVLTAARTPAAPSPDRVVRGNFTTVRMASDLARQLAAC